MKPRYRHDRSSLKEYRNPALRTRKTILLNSILNISRMINVRRQTLYLMAQYLTDPFEADRVYSIRTIYTRGPVIAAELRRLEIIRDDLRRCIPKL